MNLKLDTCWGVCNTPLPIRDKYLINTYLLNLISGNDWMVRVGAYCIRHTNTHDHGQMIDPPDTFRGICNTPLHIRVKNLIPLWTMNPKLGTCLGVCNTPLPIRIKNLIPLWTMNLKLDICLGVFNMPLSIRDKYLINTYLLNPIPEKEWIVWIIMPIKPGTFLDVCNTPLPIRVKNLIPLCTMNLKPGTCGGVCNTPLPVRVKNLIPIYWMNLKLGRFLGVCICGQLHLGGKLLKFVWEYVKPAED